MKKTTLLGVFIIGSIACLSEQAFAVVTVDTGLGAKGDEVDRKLPPLVASQKADQAESEISLRRLKAGYGSDEQSISFLRQVESLRQKLEGR